jgi:hypothetical protein
MTGNEYATLIAAYLARNYGARGLAVYREVSLGKSIIGKNRRVDVFAVHRESRKALAVECKVQTSAGTADEKIPYTLQDLAAMHVPAFVVYAGAGFSEGVLHLLRSSERAAYCLPDATLEPSPDTLELDHIVAMTFGWWDAVLRDKKPFDLSAWAAVQSEPATPPPQSRIVVEDPEVGEAGARPMNKGEQLELDARLAQS